MAGATQTAGVPLRPTAWTDAVTFQEVDPALGIQTIGLSLTASVSSTVSVSNLDLTPTIFNVAAGGSVTLSRLNGSSWLKATPTAFLYGVLPAASGTDAAPVQLSGVGSATDSVQYRQGGASVASQALIGTGQVTLPVNASVAIHGTGPANMIARFTSLAAADASLTATMGADPNADGSFSAGTYQFSILSTPPFGLLLSGATKSQTLTATTALSALSRP